MINEVLVVMYMYIAIIHTAKLTLIIHNNYYDDAAYADPFINTRRPNPYIVNEFDRVYLPCDSNYNNRIIISGGIVFVDAITRDVVVRSSSIYFGRVSRSMGRVYRCRTEFPNGMMLFSSPFNLTVQCKFYT